MDWGNLLLPHDYPYYWPVYIGSQVKVTNLKNLPKLKFLILKKTLDPTNLLKLLDKMCKYEKDPASIVEDTEQKRFCPHTNRRTDGQTDKVKPVYPPSTWLSEGYKVQWLWSGLAVYFLNQSKCWRMTDSCTDPCNAGAAYHWNAGHIVIFWIWIYNVYCWHWIWIYDVYDVYDLIYNVYAWYLNTYCVWLYLN